MARTTKQLSGGGKDKFLRAVVAGETSVGGEVAERLAATLTDAITEVRVRREVWEATSKPAPGEKGLRAAKVKAAATASVAAAKAETPPSVAKPVAPAATPFDPFAFSAVAVLTKKGKAALAAELGKVAAAADLKSIATAQHLAIDLSIEDAAALREALVTATERRIADRRAAAG